MIAPIRRILTSQIYELSPDELRDWRLSQPGSFTSRNGHVSEGWTQERAAHWIGVHARTWQSWEGKPGLSKSHPAPLWAVRRIVEYSVSLDAKLDRMLA